jgi:FkbM family methyltransferase
MYGTWMKLRRKVSETLDRKVVAAVCREYGLQLPRLGPRETAVFKEVFIGKAYADGFPFYRPAVVVDIGAHWGFFTLFAARNLAAEGRIVAVEPSRDNLAALRRHLTLNKVADRVQVFGAAVAATDGEAFLHAEASENRSLFRPSDREEGRTGDKADAGEAVETITLESLFRQAKLEVVDFLKMDCEGAEYEILRQAPEAVLSSIRCISLEFHDLKRPEATGRELSVFLKSKGFTIARCTHETTFRNLNTGKLLAFRE